MRIESEVQHKHPWYHIFTEHVHHKTYQYKEKTEDGTLCDVEVVVYACSLANCKYKRVEKRFWARENGSKDV